MSTQEKEMQFLFPEHEVELAGQTFTIKPFSLYQTSIVAKNLKGVFSFKLFTNLQDIDLGELFGENYEGFRKIIAMVYDIPEKTVDQFDIDTAIKAISEILYVNKDFFSKTVENTLTKAMDQLKAGSGKRPQVK
jgi:hypothetical protein